MMETSSKIKQKWRDAVCVGNTGFLALPEVLLRRQQKLGLNQTELVVLINILSFWWDEDKLPFPGNQRIADRMGVDTRTVQRALTSLESKGLIRRVKKLTSDDEVRRYFDLQGLVDQLEGYAKDIHMANDSRSRSAA